VSVIVVVNGRTNSDIWSSSASRVTIARLQLAQILDIVRAQIRSVGSDGAG